MQYELSTDRAPTILFDTTPPDHITLYDQYDPMHTINRKNFMAATLHAFAFSKGKRAMLRIWFDWLEANTGFDYKNTYSSFFHVVTRPYHLHKDEIKMLKEKPKKPHKNVPHITHALNSTPLMILNNTLLEHYYPGSPSFEQTTEKALELREKYGLQNLRGVSHSELLRKTGPYFQELHKK